MSSVGPSRDERVTRDVEPTALAALLADPPRVSVAFMNGDRVDVLPARAYFGGGRHAFAVRVRDAPDLGGAEVVLVCDDGPYWFDLRGVSLRGIAVPSDPPSGQTPGSLAWYAIDVRRVLAWDYGALRALPQGEG